MKNKTAFLNEYPCTFIDEHKFLKQKGFRYTYVKVIDGITTWKYAKDLKLIEALMEFYITIEINKT